MSKRPIGMISTGQVHTYSNRTIHYDTNLTVGVSTDTGITAQGSHGRFAKFEDVRKLPLVPSTEDYSISLVRGNVTTDNFPLFVPLIRQSTASNPNPVTENGTQIWETQAQPGLALTWTGPVYTMDSQLGMNYGTEAANAAWPSYGTIPYYIYTQTTSSTSVNYRLSGFINLGAISSCADCSTVSLLSRLNTALSGLAGGNLLITVTAIGSTGTYPQYGQTLSFSNNGAYNVVFDFTLPGSTQQFNNGVVPAPTKAGILQACKLFGFQPNTVFNIPCRTSGVSAVVSNAPRPFQLALRTTLNLYSYKNVRWVPQDTSAALPTATDMANGSYLGSYFDCYDYDHFLNECVNPTFQRIIFDQFDDSVVGSEKCLQRQLTNACAKNCNARLPWSFATSYAVNDTVTLNGRAYYAQFANTGVVPSSNAYEWVDIGSSFLNSFIPGNSYVIGDVVTLYNNTSGNPYFYTCTAATSVSPPNTSYWQSGFINTYTVPAFSLITPNTPTIGTLAPFVSFDASKQLFNLNCDSYGFGGTLKTNADDGYFGVSDDNVNQQTQLQQYTNATLNDQARDSWGLTGLFNYLGSVSSTLYTTYRKPFEIYDERFVIEADDYFNQLFGNWQTQRLNYADPRFGGAITSYVRYILEATTAGLAVPLPLPLQTPTVATGYLPFGRVGGNQPYLYTFPQNYPSVGLMWNPIDTIVVVSGSVPLVDDQVLPPIIIGDNGQAIGTVESSVAGGSTSFSVGNSGGGQSTNANTLRILGEFIVKSGSMQTGQELRNQIVFEPQFPIRVSLLSGPVFNKFDYQLFMRMKSTQILRPVTISNGGSVNMRFELTQI